MAKYKDGTYHKGSFLGESNIDLKFITCEDKIVSFHMVSIYSKQHLTWLWKNVCISIIKICTSILEMCFVLLCTISMYWLSKSISRSAQFQCHPKNKFSCVLPNYTLYYLCQMSFKWKEAVSIVWGFYRLNYNWKTLHKKRCCNYGDINC